MLKVIVFVGSTSESEPVHFTTFIIYLYLVYTLIVALTYTKNHHFHAILGV